MANNRSAVGKTQQGSRAANGSALVPCIDGASGHQRARVGRPSSYKPEYAKQALAMTKLGATDADLAEAFDVSVVTIWQWKSRHADFVSALKVGKEEADDRVVRALYTRAVGYSLPATKIFRTREGKIVEHHHLEHVPPDVTACIFWLKNRLPAEWRRQEREPGATGHYIIADRPLTPEEWIEQRATIVEREG